MRKAIAQPFLFSLLVGLLTALSLITLPPEAALSAPAGGPALLVPQAQPDQDRTLRQLLPANQPEVPTLSTRDHINITAYLEYFLDEADFVDITEISEPQFQERFQFFNPSRMPRYDTGTLWLRFVLPALQPGADTQRLILNLGSSVPGVPVLYTPNVAADGTVIWKEEQSERGRVLLPAQTEGMATLCLVRIDGIPGQWFCPVVTTPEASLDSFVDWHLAAIIALGTVLILCLLKGLVEPGQWRLWALLYLAAALAQTWAGPAPLQAGYTPKTIAGMTCAGIALMLWPHVGRHLLDSRHVSRLLDTSLILLCLPGAAAALLPLVPQFQWLSRYTELWPLCLAIFLPSALWGCVCGARSSFKFLLATLLPPLAVAAGVLGLRSGFAPEYLAVLPAFGVALGALTVLALATTPRKESEYTAAPMNGMPGYMAGGESGMHLNVCTPAPQDEPVELGAPIEEETKEQGLYADYLNPLVTLEKSLTDMREPELPGALQGEIADLLHAAKNIASEIKVLEEQAEEDKRNASRTNVVIISSDPGFCAVLTHVLRREDCHIRQAANFDEALELGRKIPARLYIFQGPYATVEAHDTISALKTLPAAGGKSVFLAYTEDESPWRSLAKAGFTHALVLPIDDSSLINTLNELKEDDAKEEEHHEDVSAQDAADHVPDLFGAAPMTPPAQASDAGLPLAEPAIKDDLTRTTADQPVFQLGAPIETVQKDMLTISMGDTDNHAPMEPLSMGGTPGTAREKSTVPLSMDGASEQLEVIPEALHRDLVVCLSQASIALSAGDLGTLQTQAGILATKSKSFPVIAKLAGLVVQAALSGDRTAARELLVELAQAVNRRSGRGGF